MRQLVLTMAGGDPGGGGASSCSCREEANSRRGNIDSRQPPFLCGLWDLPLGGGGARKKHASASCFITLGVRFCNEIIIEAISLRFLTSTVV